MNTNLESLAFLSPAQGKDELGRLGPYRILKLLGQGGMGMVFLAEDPQLQRTVALKTLLPEVAKRPVAKERFLREARATAKIEHDHIVTIYQVGEDRGIPFLAMQLLKGASLEDFLKKKQGKTATPITVEQILRIGREIARGLQAAHEHGLIHRDIKPANIWLDASAGGRVKILDFGLARAADVESKLTQLGAVVGTAAYMAPEQARSDKIDARADLFSLGVILYRLCTGRHPWKGGDAMETLVAIATETPTPVTELNPEVPVKLSRLIMMLLAKQPEGRPAAAKSVAEAIQVIERELPTQAIKAAVPKPVSVPSENTMNDGAYATNILVRRTQHKGRKRRKPWLLAGAAAVLLTVVVAGFAFFGSSDTGTLKIETIDDKVQVIVEKGGKRVKVLDKASGGSVTLEAGDYRLKLDKPRADIKLDKEQVTITRNGVVVVTVSKVKQVAALPKNDPPKTQREPPRTFKEPPRTFKEPFFKNDPPVKEPPDVPPPPDVKHFHNSLDMRFAAIPAGEFMMGASEAETRRFPGVNEPGNLPHKVRITKGFYMGAYPVTVGQFRKFIEASGHKPNRTSNGHDWQNPIDQQTEQYPVVLVSWHDAAAFCKWLSDKERRSYQLPTEAQWEYACRAGSPKAYSFGDDPNDLRNYGWFHDNSGNKRHPVGKLRPNRWGLFDMHGNVYQWVQDWYDPNYYRTSPDADPTGPARGVGKDPAKIMRGGEFSYPVWSCRSAALKARAPSYAINRTGFRVLLATEPRSP